VDLVGRAGEDLPVGEEGLQRHGAVPLDGVVDLVGTRRRRPGQCGQGGEERRGSARPGE
jgi:hypothetical protein